MVFFLLHLDMDLTADPEKTKGDFFPPNKLFKLITEAILKALYLSIPGKKATLFTKLMKIL